MPIAEDLFRQQFNVFQGRILRKSGKPFRGFKEGLAFEWEGYKEDLRRRALARLRTSTWRRSDIGSGRILRRVISSIEIPDEGPELPDNNFVTWQPRNGPSSQVHRKLVEAIDEPSERQHFEEWAFALFREDASPQWAFERFCELAGARYELVAYLMFLFDSERFLPIRVRTFDAAFEALGIGIQMEGNCTWENYLGFMGGLADVRDRLRTMPNLEDASIMDAHSFCWLLVRPEVERDDDRLINSEAGRATNARKAGAAEHMAFEMARSIAETVANSNGQQYLATKKDKQLMMIMSELQPLLLKTMEKQGYRCAISQLPLQFAKDYTDLNMLASPDRIDSNGHYSGDNIQVVCRFINFWKRDTPDAEFRRLLAILRDPSQCS